MTSSSKVRLRCPPNILSGPVATQNVFFLQRIAEAQEPNQDTQTHKVSASVMSKLLFAEVSYMAQPKINGVGKCALPRMQ